MKIAEVIGELERFAPPAIQESFDNTGYQVGDPDDEVTGVMVCVDATEAIVDEAADKDINLLITHHPLLFKAVKSIIGRNRPERVLAKAIKRGVTIYSSHTSTDSTPGGVSWRMAKMLGLTDVTTLVPHTPGNPVGLGAIGNLPKPMSVSEFVELVKKAFGCAMVKMSRPAQELMIERVALCGGSAAEFIPDAIDQGAQVYVTADCKLNNFLDYTPDILLIDAGHYETEQCTKQIFCDVLSEKFPNFAVCKSEKEINPIIYS